MSVILAENDDLHRAFARQVIGDLWQGDVEIFEAVSGKEAIELVKTHSIGRAVLDLQLPNGNGVEVARAIWALNPEAPILFWSNFSDETYIRGLDRIVPSGASYGYLLKSASEAEMRSALETVFIKERRVIDREIRAVQKRVTNHLAALSDAEYEGLIDIALGLTDKVIADRRHLSIRGVQNRLRHLYEKFDIAHQEQGKVSLYNSRARAITLALERGLINLEVLQREQAMLDEWLEDHRVRS